MVHGEILENDYAIVTQLVSGGLHEFWDVHDKANDTTVRFARRNTAILAFNTITSNALALKAKEQISKPLIEEGPNYGSW